MSDHTTTLSLYDATGILSALMDTKKDITKCDYCLKQLVGDTYNTCRFPDAPAGTRGLPDVHIGHTACEECAESLAYIGEAGSCVACYNALGGRRSALKLAGVALRPPVKNQLASKMIGCFKDAEDSIEAAHEETDQARIQEGADRRAAAVADVRRRKEEARLKAEAEAADLKEQAEREAAELKKKAQEEAAAAKAAAEKLQEEADAAKAAAEKTQEEADAAKAAAEKEAEEITERATLAARREASDRRREHQAAIDKAREEGRAAAAAEMPQQAPIDPENMTKAGRPRKRKAIDDDVIKARTAAANKTRADKKFKSDQYPILLAENKILKAKLDALMIASKNAIEMAGGEIDPFEEQVDAEFAEIEEQAGAADEEDDEEEENAETVD